MNKTLVSIIGGLSGMFGWGTSDFFANISSEKIGHHKTLFWSQTAGLLLIAITMFIFTRDYTISSNLWIAYLVAGITYTFGYLNFYKGFEVGNVSVVSALVNVQNIFVILVTHFVMGQSLTSLQIPAIIMILLGVTLVSVDFSEFKKGGQVFRKGVKETLIASFLFGAIYWPVSEYLAERTDWILATFVLKLIALVTLLGISFFNKTKLALENADNKTKWTVAVVGLLEAVAVLGVSFGVSIGDAILVSPISSALTLVTVALAVIFLKEKVNKQQAFGILLAVAGIVLTAF